MKAVVTAAGNGTRSGLDGKFRKEMLPVYDCREGRLVLRPIIDCIIHQLNSNGIYKIAAILRNDDTLTRAYVRKEFPEVEIIFQEKPRGYGDAVLQASEFVGKDGFVLNAGDGFLLKSKDFFSKVQGVAGKSGNLINIMKVENPGHYGCPLLSMEGETITVKEIEEKPLKPKSGFGLSALYYLDNRVMKILAEMNGDNVELTPAIDMSIKAGVKTIANEISRDDWISVGKAEEYSLIINKSRDHVRTMGC